MVGPGDLAASLGMPHTAIGAPVPDYPGDGWHHVLGRVVVAARAAGVQAVNGPWAVIDDEDGLVASARRSRGLGYDGKWSIHPRQIGPLNEVYGVPEAALAHARRVLDAHAAAAARGEGAASLDGEMIDEATRAMAARLVERARLTGAVTRAGGSVRRFPSESPVGKGRRSSAIVGPIAEVEDAGPRCDAAGKRRGTSGTGH